MCSHFWGDPNSNVDQRCKVSSVVGIFRIGRSPITGVVYLAG